MTETPTPEEFADWLAKSQQRQQEMWEAFAEIGRVFNDALVKFAILTREILKPLHDDDRADTPRDDGGE